MNFFFFWDGFALLPLQFVGKIMAKNSTIMTQKFKHYDTTTQAPNPVFEMSKSSTEFGANFNILSLRDLTENQSYLHTILSIIFTYNHNI